MTKYEKIALQCAKDDIKKGNQVINLKKSKANYVSLFKQNKYPLVKAIDFKNWNKKIGW